MTISPRTTAYTTALPTMRFGMPVRHEARVDARDSVEIRFGNTRLETMRGSQLLFHHTELFREMETLWQLPGLLKNKFPQGVPVEIYAGSNGADALSMGILMRGVLGAQQAQRYPIITSDLMPDLFERSQQGIVGLLPNKAEGNPWEDLRTKWGTMRLYVRQRDGVDIGALSDCLDPQPIAPELYPEFRLKHSRHPRYKSQGNWWTSTSEYEQLYRLRPEVKAQLDRQIVFAPDPVDVIQALVHQAKPSATPRVIFLRNMIYMLSMPEMRQLTQALGENMASGSLLVLGATEQSNHLYDRDLFYSLLKDGGWRPHPDIDRVWVKE